MPLATQATASDLTRDASAFLHILAGFTTTAVLLGELRPILRLAVWVAGVVA